MPNGNDIDWENFNYNEYAINLVSIIDRKTNESINTLDLTSDLPKNAYLDTVTYRNGKICAYTTTYNDLTYEMSTTVTELDPMTGDVLDKYENSTDNDGGSIERTFKVADYTVDTSLNWDNMDNAYYDLYITAADGTRSQVRLKESGMNLYNIPVVFSIGDDKALVPVSTDKDSVYYELDLKTSTATLVDGKDYSSEDLSGLFLRELVKDIEMQNGVKVDGAVMEKVDTAIAVSFGLGRSRLV